VEFFGIKPVIWHLEDHGERFPQRLRLVGNLRHGNVARRPGLGQDQSATFVAHFTFMSPRPPSSLGVPAVLDLSLMVVRIAVLFAAPPWYIRRLMPLLS